MSFLNPFASKQQSADFSQSETNVEYSFTEKDESVGRDNGNWARTDELLNLLNLEYCAFTCY